MKEVRRLERRTLQAAGEAVRDFDLIAAGDRVLVAVSRFLAAVGLEDVSRCRCH